MPGINLYGILKPLIRSYYQGLTIHGVLNAIVFTSFLDNTGNFLCIICLSGNPALKPISPMHVD
ncbi:MAG: hypothetical protein R2865_15570 [Deinococcales bacterium]